MVDFIDYSDPNTTVILKNTIIEGNIKTNGSFELVGKVNGNVEVDNLSSVFGTINGNVESRDLIVRDKASIIGDINLLFDGYVGFDSRIDGNVTCKNIEILGNIVGNIKAEDSVIIRGSANVEGDICCHSLVVDQGGKINGNVKLIYTR